MEKELKVILKEVINNRGEEVLCKPVQLLAWILDFFPDKENLLCDIKRELLSGVTHIFVCKKNENALSAQFIFDEITDGTEQELQKDKVACIINVLFDVFELQRQDIKYERDSNDVKIMETTSPIVIEDNIDYYEMAMSYKNNTGITDIDNYIDNLEKSVMQNNLKACHMLGNYYLKGKYIQQNLDKGLEYLDRCVEANDYRVAYEVFCSLKNERHGTALKYLKIAADGGIVQAEYDYGLYLYDCGTAEELQNAVLYLKKASSSNHAYAMYQLALCYQLGKGVSRDVKIAKEYLIKAAELGVYKAKEILEGL